MGSVWTGLERAGSDSPECVEKCGCFTNFGVAKEN